MDEYVELLKESKAKIDEIQPGDEVIMGGLVSGSEDYWRQMLEAGVYDYTDAMVIHGKQINYDAYLDVYEEFRKTLLYMHGGKLLRINLMIRKEIHSNALLT